MSNAKWFELAFESRISRWTLLLLAMLLWLLNHPLTTLWHDARIYAVLALHWLDPQAYARDPFFMFGSQDSYSLFSPLYGPLIAKLGLRSAHTVVMVIGGVLWCVAAVRLSLACMQRTWLAGAATLALAVFMTSYAPNGVTFTLNENFATARTIAVPLGVLALADCVMDRWRKGVIWSVVSMLIHPLLGVWPLVISVLWPLSWRWRWRLIAAAAVTLAVLMLSEFGPFVRFDAEWEVIARRVNDVFVHPLDAKEPLRWSMFVFHLLLSLSAAWYTRKQAPHVARLYFLVALVSASGLLAATVASWFWPSRLVIQAQLWRSMWMVTYLMPLTLTHLAWLFIRSGLASLRRHGDQPWWLLLAGVLVLMLRDSLLWALLVWWAFILGRYWVLRWLGQEVLDRLTSTFASAQKHRWFAALAIAFVLAALPALWQDLWILGLSTPLSQFAVPELIGFFVAGGCGIGFSLLAWWCARFGGHIASLCLVGLLLIIALWRWDIRTENVKVWEAGASFGLQGGMRELIKSGDVVLWHSKRIPIETWFDLRTAHYAGLEQSTGMVFSREKTFELMERAQRIRAARVFEGGSDDLPADENKTFGFVAPEGKGIPMLCQDAELDWIVTNPKAKPAYPGGTPFLYDDGTVRKNTLYLYRCSDFRKPA